MSEAKTGASLTDFLRGMITGASLLVLAFVVLDGDFPAPFAESARHISVEIPDASGLGPDAQARIAHSLETFLKAFILVERDHVTARLDAETVARMLDGALYRLDRYSGFMNAERTADYASPVEQERSRRLGISVMDVDGKYTIEAVSPGSPAEEADIRPGDRVVRVAGSDMAEQTPAAINDLIRSEIERSGAGGFDLGVSRPNIEGEIVRHVRPAPFPEVPVLDLGQHEGVLHLAIERFYEGMSEDVAATIERARVSGKVKGVALDLRDNSGGLTSEARSLAELFLPQGVLLYEMIGREGSLEEVLSTHPPTYPDMGLSVIVNGNSASASEIFAAAIQAHDRGRVVGWQTYGKGSIQRVYPMDDGSIKITVAEYHDAAHRRINGLGVDPDILVSQEDPGMRLSRFVPDPARRAALEAAGRGVR